MLVTDHPCGELPTEPQATICPDVQLRFNCCWLLVGDCAAKLRHNLQSQRVLAELAVGAKAAALRTFTVPASRLPKVRDVGEAGRIIEGRTSNARCGYWNPWSGRILSGRAVLRTDRITQRMRWRVREQRGWPWNQRHGTGVVTNSAERSSNDHAQCLSERQPHERQQRWDSTTHMVDDECEQLHRLRRLVGD